MDPLSSYLFVLSFEILGQIIKSNKIKGIKVNNEEIKILQYADDTVAIVNNLPTVKKMFEEIEQFGGYSGLKINRDKSEGYWLGRNRHSNSKPLSIKLPEQGIKILGVYHPYNQSKTEQENYYNTLNKLLTN